MTLLRPAPVSTSHFTYFAPERLLVAEASSLPDFERVWDDACDEGLTIVSEYTGRSIVFAVTHTERDREGDLAYWDLSPASRSDDCGVKVRVYND